MRTDEMLVRAAHATDCIEVVAAVITRPDGSFLMADRPAGKVYAGYWEFPGGKVEPGETTRAALARELQEELGIVVRSAAPWLTRVHAYEHATVRLNFFRLTAWQGEPHPHEGQRIAWSRPTDAPLAPMLPANTPIFRALRLPPAIALVSVADGQSARPSAGLEAALEADLRLVIVRGAKSGAVFGEGATREAIARARARGVQLLVEAEASPTAPVGADGVHLSPAQLANITERPAGELAGASCRDAHDLERAEALRLDYALLEPHAESSAHSADLAAAAALLPRALPLYLAGRLAAGELLAAQARGVHGIAVEFPG